MKLVKTAKGKTNLKISHKEWTDIGGKMGWFKIAQAKPINWPEYQEIWNTSIGATPKIDAALLNQMKEYAQSVAENYSEDLSGSKKGNLIKFEELAKDMAKHFGKPEWLYDEDSDLWSVVGYIVDAWYEANTKETEPVSTLTEEEEEAKDEAEFQASQREGEEIEKELQEMSPGPESPRWAKTKKQLLIAKKEKKSPKEHGFIDQCIKENPDKKSPGGYCASIVDKVKGTTKWRSEKLAKKINLVKHTSSASEDSLRNLILKNYSRQAVLAAIKRLGEESIAGFSNVSEDDVPSVLAMCEEFELKDIINVLQKH